MSGKAARVTFTESMYDILERLANSRTTAQSIATRMQIILFAWHNLTNTQISEPVNLGRQQVGLWRRRWRDSYQALLAIEFRESLAQFERSIVDVFRDAPRSGAAGTFTASKSLVSSPLHVNRPAIRTAR